MAKKKKQEKHIVFNWRILIWIFASIVFLCFSIEFFKSKDTELGFPLLGVSLFLFLGIFITPLYYSFSKTELLVIWLFQYKRVIPWCAVKNVVEFKWGEVHRDLPKYELIYHLNYKGHIITKQFDIPKNRQTKILVEKYAKSKIV